MSMVEERPVLRTEEVVTNDGTGRGPVPISPNLIHDGNPSNRQKCGLLSSPDMFGHGSNAERRFIRDYDALTREVAHIKGLGKTIVLVLGVWDLVHIGQARYIEECSARGDVVIVGVELDEAVQLRKGPRRPVVDFQERVEMLCHLRHVDLVVPVLDYQPDTGLSGMQVHEIIRPDVVVASRRSFVEDATTWAWIDRVSQYCGRVDILQDQAPTSSTEKIRKIIIHYGDIIEAACRKAKESIDGIFTGLTEQVKDAVTKH